MSDDDPRDGYFGESVAAQYDPPDDPAVDAPDVGSGGALDPAVVALTVDVLERLARAAAGAGTPRALELAVGTGRIALPLAARGVAVHGIELSRAMLQRLRAKPGADAVTTTVGDMASTRVDGAFELVYLVFNTVMNLVTQDQQVACFRNAAEHLVPGGAFVVEVMVPDLRRLPPGQEVRPFHVGEDGWAYDVYDTVGQGLTSNYVTVTPDGRGSLRSIPFRYVWPAELDLMARLAGLGLQDRWADWSGAAFTAESGKHVSVWIKA